MSSKFTKYFPEKPQTLMVGLIQIYYKLNFMAQITITIPDHVKELLDFLCKEKKRPLSDLVSHCLEIGISQFVEAANKEEVYRSLIRKKSSGESPTEK